MSTLHRMTWNGLWADPRGAYAILALLAFAMLGATMAPGGLRDWPRRSSRIVAGAVRVGALLPDSNVVRGWEGRLYYERLAP